MKNKTIDRDSIIVAAVPVFGGRVPQIAVKRMMKLNANGCRAAAVVVYGNRAYDDALLELKDTLNAIGCRVIAGGAFVAEHSMVREIAAGRPNQKDLEAAFEFGKKIANALKQDDKKDITVPGNPNYKNKKTGNGMKPKTGKSCSKCGECSKVCPVGAIPVDNPQKTSKSCIGCMRCVSVCPNNARALPKQVLLLAGAVLSSAKKKSCEPEIFF